MIYAYANTINEFLTDAPATIIAQLHTALAADGFSRQWTAQTTAWQNQLRVLRDAAATLITRNTRIGESLLCLEYEIARRGRRIDATIVTPRVVIVLEFKASQTAVNTAAHWQVREYALDLRDFHAGSSNIPIVPVLATTSDESSVDHSNIQLIQGVNDVVTCTSATLADVLENIIRAAQQGSTPRIDIMGWRDAPYRPSPNIIEAAQRIFAGQQVREISHATAENLTATVDAIVAIVNAAREQSRRVICFVTGVPGAGKTLAGLSAVHHPYLRPDTQLTAVFLSGNGPLVKIIRAALVRDLKQRQQRNPDSARQVSTFIQNVHTFLGHYALDAKKEVPPEHVVVFDEAQRAWSAEQMKRKDRGTASEAALVLDVMERCSSWAVIVALVGFGQEIHQGEAGLEAWGEAVRARAEKWDIAASPLVLGGEDATVTARLFETDPPKHVRVQAEPTLHLNTSTRSPRASMMSDWVEAVLEGDAARARHLFQHTQEFPINYTRDLQVARVWLREQAEDHDYPGNAGIVASSGGLRLRAYGLELSSGFRRGFPYEEWFLANGNDTRASAMLEVAATEFECQGLELDWVAVAWAGDLVRDSTGWTPRRFSGNRWLRIQSPVGRRFIINKYRVLLTRARKGILIWVPAGSSRDTTLASAQFDLVANYLDNCGVPQL
jgi:hypothetical protein